MRKNFVYAALALAVCGLLVYGAAFAADAAKQSAEPAKKEAAAASSTDSALSPTTTIAKVNGEAIKGVELLNMKNSMRSPAAAAPLDAVYGQLQDRLIDGKLLADAAKKSKIEKDKDVQDRLKKAEERIVQDAYLNKEIAQKITPDKVEARYKKMAAEFKPQPEMKARHILVATEAEAKDIAAKLKGGADFAKLAKEKSTDKGSAENGGDIGFFSADQVVEPFSKAAFALKDGEVSAPVQTQFGWHIIQAVSRRDSKMPPLDDVKGDLQQVLADEMLKDLFAKLRQGAKIEKFAIDGKPVAEPKPAEPAAKAVQ